MVLQSLKKKQRPEKVPDGVNSLLVPFTGEGCFQIRGCTRKHNLNNFCHSNLHRAWVYGMCSNPHYALTTKTEPWAFIFLTFELERKTPFG